MIRLFVQAPLRAGAEIEPSAEQSHYLLNVMRRKPADTLRLFNGVDGEWLGRITQATKRSCRLRLEQQLRPQAPTPDLDLVVALVKRARLETIVEKAAELGVRRIRLALTRRTNADHANIQRLQSIAVEASEQTGRLDVPQVYAPQPLSELVDGAGAGRRLMFCDEAGDDDALDWGGPAGRAAPALQALSGREQAPFAILIGPEGGFDPDERARLRELPFVTAVTLGPRILRADTAAIAALTLWQAAVGDWRSA